MGQWAYGWTKTKTARPGVVRYLYLYVRDCGRCLGCFFAECKTIDIEYTTILVLIVDVDDFCRHVSASC